MKFNQPQSLKGIAGFLGCIFKGDPDFPISGINEIHMVEPGDLTFVDHPKYYNKALGSKASIILINKEVDCPEGKALIFSNSPFEDYMKLVQNFRPFEAASKMISESAKIGEGSIVQPGAFIGNHVVIGKNCIIHANVSIYDHCILGNNVIIHSGTVIGADAFYFQKREKETLKFESCGRVLIKDHVEIGANCTIDKGVSGDTIIDEYTKFDNHVQIGHDTYIGKRCLFASAVLVAGVTHIEDDVILWGQVAVNKDLRVGKGAILLGTSAIDKSIEGGKVYFGAPAVEAREKWKELVHIRRLPEMYEKLNKLIKDAEKVK
ncbi:MAG: UDP-3-O-(3-hydroxymyristoyl)glucosamine N-acyltransferase [Bacteroidales bacterium]|nr:UDP-3-O-(3-hydroxymyristoyl)glucosamine N-acyltransferase [Bacteroidales bacterium]MCF8405648.1 UDP-3-O-(3-hydroxymyristoyl)glucosamine N-acyltransferase [Bacteroidales bacterium]